MRITERSKMKLVEELRFKNIDEVMMYENELNEDLDKDYYFRLNHPLFQKILYWKFTYIVQNNF